MVAVVSKRSQVVSAYLSKPIKSQSADSNFSLVRSRLFPETAILRWECAATARHNATAFADDAAFALWPLVHSAIDESASRLCDRYSDLRSAKLKRPEHLT